MYLLRMRPCVCFLCSFCEHVLKIFKASIMPFQMLKGQYIGEFNVLILLIFKIFDSSVRSQSPYTFRYYRVWHLEDHKYICK